MLTVCESATYSNFFRSSRRQAELSHIVWKLVSANICDKMKMENSASRPAGTLKAAPNWMPKPLYWTSLAETVIPVPAKNGAILEISAVLTVPYTRGEVDLWEYDRLGRFFSSRGIRWPCGCSELLDKILEKHVVQQVLIQRLVSFRGILRELRAHSSTGVNAQINDARSESSPSSPCVSGLRGSLT